MIAFLDIETTGLSEQYCSILEIAAVACDASGEVVTTFHEYINPGKPIPENIVKLTRITDSVVKFAKKEWQVLEELIEWLQGNGITEVVIHNASFDMRFLRGRSARFNLVGCEFDFINVTDSMKLARELIKKGKFMTYKTGNGQACVKQEAIAEALGVIYGEGGAHSAIEDVLVLKQIYTKMVAMR